MTGGQLSQYCRMLKLEDWTVFGDITLIPKFEGGHPERGALNEGGVGR